MMIEVNERELRAILSAFDMARDQTANASWRWWNETGYVNKLYYRLRAHGFTTPNDAVDAALDGLVADGSLDEA